MRTLFAPLLLIGVLWMLRWVLLVVLGVAVLLAVLWWAINAWDRRDDARRAIDAELAARADQQHAWVLAGDDRGVYGDYAPKQPIELVQSQVPDDWAALACLREMYD